jgi:putative Holliday junction resolvase
VLGIDAGERRVGVAMSDESRSLASPVIVLDRRRGLAPVLDALADLARRFEVQCAVVGLPLNADGSEGPQARRARDFARVAARVVGIPVSLWDERLSTQEAESILRAQGRNVARLRRQGQIDAVAAAVILQDYLDHSRQEFGDEVLLSDTGLPVEEIPVSEENLPPLPGTGRGGSQGSGSIPPNGAIPEQ